MAAPGVEGHRVGRQLEITLGDGIGEGDEGAPARRPWKQVTGSVLEHGKHIIIGITYLTADGEFEKQEQMHGDIELADEKKGIGIRLANGTMYWLPPDLRAIKAARPGEYRFRSSGEVVVNPGLMTTWTFSDEWSH